MDVGVEVLEHLGGVRTVGPACDDLVEIQRHVQLPSFDVVPTTLTQTDRSVYR
jgi:hypothetical protein